MDELKISNIHFRFRRASQSDRVVANVDILLNNMVGIQGVRLFYNSEYKVYSIHFPCIKVKDSFYEFIKMTRAVRTSILNAIVSQYLDLKSKGLWEEN